MTGKKKPTSKNNSKKPWNSNRSGSGNSEQRIPQYIKEKGLSAINKWITYQRLSKADLIDIIMGHNSEEESDEEESFSLTPPPRKGKRKRQEEDLDKRFASLEKRIAKQIAKLKPRSSKRNLTDDDSDEDSDDEGTDLLENAYEDEEDEDYHKIDAPKIRKILKECKLRMRGDKKIANVIRTISKHEYNYRGDDKNKVKKIGTKLYNLKKSHKVAVGTTKASLCSDTEEWLPTAVKILKKITDDGRL
jgi:hypothetical protein